jgi:Tol biopolymer transport system component
MTSLRQRRASFTILLCGVTAAACGNTALGGAEDSGSGRPVADAALTGAAGTEGAAGTSGGVAGTAGGIAGTSGGAAGSVATIAGVTGAGPWLFFDSLRGLNRDIYAIQSDGSSLHRLTTSAATEREPAVSADGSTLAFSSDETGTFQVYLMSLPTGTPHQLTHDTAEAAQPTWSPDGTQIAYHSGADVYIIGTDGTNEHVAAAGLDTINADSHPVFAPSGGALIFDRYNQIHRIDLTTTVETSVIQNSTTDIQHPSVSPDGHTIAFSVSCDASGDGIWLAPLDTNTEPCVGGARLTPLDDSGPARFPAFSSTGLVAYERGAGTAHLEVANLSGGRQAVTSAAGDDRNPSWSPASLVLP